MSKIKATLTGISPILMNPMTDELLDELWAPSPQRKQRKDITPQKAAEAKLIKNDAGKTGVPAEYLLAALVYAGRFVKYDARKNMSTATTSLVPAFISLEGMFFPFKKQNEPWRVDRRRGVLNNGGKTVAVAIVRPRIDNWELEVSAEFDGDQIDESRARNLFEYAGKVAGMGDFRPSCRGPFGRFAVSKWAVAK